MLSNKEWEELCDGCGKCCTFRPDHKVACPGLDVSTKRCTVYERRHDTYMCTPVTPGNVMDLHTQGILPASCAYVRHERGLKPLPPGEHVLLPFSAADRNFQRYFHRENKKYLKKRRDTST